MRCAFYRSNGLVFCRCIGYYIHRYPTIVHYSFSADCVLRICTVLESALFYRVLKVAKHTHCERTLFFDADLRTGFFDTNTLSIHKVMNLNNAMIWSDQWFCFCPFYIFCYFKNVHCSANIKIKIIKMQKKWRTYHTIFLFHKKCVCPQDSDLITWNSNVNRTLFNTKWRIFVQIVVHLIEILPKFMRWTQKIHNYFNRISWFDSGNSLNNNFMFGVTANDFLTENTEFHNNLQSMIFFITLYTYQFV